MKSTKLQTFIRAAVFSVLGMLGVSCYILADTFFVAQGMGSLGLTALNLAIPIYNFIHGTGLMLGMGGAALFSIYKIRGEKEQANRIYSQTLVLSVAASLFFLAVGLLASRPLTVFLQAEEAVFEMTRTYLFWLLLFSPAFILNDVFLCFIRNDGEAGLPMLAMLIGSFSNVLLDYFFIFPLKLGIFGAVFATGLSPFISMLVLLPYALKKKNSFHLCRTPFQAKLVKNSLSMGFSSLLAQVSSGLVMIVFNFVILRLEGKEGVAAYGVIANLSLVVSSVYTGIAQGMQPLISESYGAGEPEECRRVLGYAMVGMAVLSVGLYALFAAGADGIAAVFNQEQNELLQKIAVSGLKIYFTSNLFVGYNIIIAIYFSSIEKVIPAHVVSLLRGFLLMLPVVILFGIWFGMTGVWLSYPVVEGITAVLGLWMLLPLLK